MDVHDRIVHCVAQQTLVLTETQHEIAVPATLHQDFSLALCVLMRTSLQDPQNGGSIEGNAKAQV